MPQASPSKISKKDAARLKSVREALGYSANKFAEEIKVTHGAISKWENCKRPIPGPVLKLIELYEEKLKKR